MSTRNLDALFRPRSVAVIGATERAGSVGAAVTRNALAGGFDGALHFVNRKGGTIAGRRAFRRVADLREAPDLAIVATPADTVPGLIAELGERGTKAAVVISAGFGASGPAGSDGARRRAAMLDAAKPHLLRIVGPNCLGFMAPRLGLNASFAASFPPAGKIAVVAQSGAVLSAIVDWGAARGLGFSYLVSMGDMADVDFGDVLDYLASDVETRAILLYVEAVTGARKFMSAARAVARLKPVIALKAGRHAEGARAAASHTGAMAGADAVYDAAFRRAGLVRVFSLGELFDAAETLGLARAPAGDGLAILSNGGGIGVIATDDVMDRRGRLATLSPPTLAALDAVLPATWSRANPIDIIGDADGARFAAAYKALAGESDIGALIALYAPTALADPLEAARITADFARTYNRPVLACWLGGFFADQARRIFTEAGVPSFDTPQRAVRGFMHLVEYRRGQDALLETPPSVPDEKPDTAAARSVVAAALAEGRTVLTEPEAKRVLAAYGIPVVPTEIAADAAAAVRAAEGFGYPVAVKLLSRDITHKSDVGGVALDLDRAEAVSEAVAAIRRRAAAAAPAARIDGFVVQPMVRRPGAHELILGAAEDPTFGPILMFGQGGTAAEILSDKAIALPPLNIALAEATMRATRIDRLLAGYRNRPPAARREIAATLVRLSRLVADLGEVAELDINPLLADASGVIALDARIVVRGTAPGAERARRLAIRPYPSELEEVFEHRGRKLLIRPIRPEDEPALQRVFKQLSADDVRMRFFAPLRGLTHEMAARLSQIDYDREMALVLLDAPGETPAGGPADEAGAHGIVRLTADPSFATAEFAITVVSARQGMGIGRLLMARILAYAKSRGIASVFGNVLSDNTRMLDLARALGFRAQSDPSDRHVVRIVKDL